MIRFEKPKYSNDEIKLHIKRFERELKKLQNKYNTALLREKEMFSKPHTFKDVAYCHYKYGDPKLINVDICCHKRRINDLKEILKGDE